MPGLDWGTILMQYARAIGWSITAAVGFAFGIGIALKVFDILITILKHISYTPHTCHIQSGPLEAGTT